MGKEQSKANSSNTGGKSKHLLEWTTGKKSSNTMQTLVVDGAWKNKRENQWKSTIAWKNKNGFQGEESATRIFANSTERTEAYAILAQSVKRYGMEIFGYNN